MFMPAPGEFGGRIYRTRNWRTGCLVLFRRRVRKMIIWGDSPVWGIRMLKTYWIWLRGVKSYLQYKEWRRGYIVFGKKRSFVKKF